MQRRASLSVSPFQKLSKQAIADVTAESMRLSQFMEPDASGHASVSRLQRSRLGSPSKLPWIDGDFPLSPV
jgi:hypothetical protein